MNLQSYKIIDVMGDISHNKYILPSFQRPFVWSESQISALFDSIMRDYPIGVPLMWKTNGAKVCNRYLFFEFLKFYISKGAGTNSVGVQYSMPKSNADYLVVLDGQQRLTALYLGINGYLQRDGSTSEKCYLYLNISKLNPSEVADEEEFEDDEDSNEDIEDNNLKSTNAAIVSTSLNEKYVFRFMPQNGILPKDVILYKGERWFLVKKVQDFSQMSDINRFARKEDLSDSQTDAIVNLWQRICDTDLLSIQIDGSGNFDEAVLKFIRANMYGKPISKPEILRTMATASNVFTRDEFKDLRKEIEANTGFLKNTNLIKASDFFIKVILSLLSHSVGSKIENFDTTFLALLQSEYTKIRETIVETFNLLKGMGINNDMLLSNNALIPIIFYNFYRPSGPVKGKDAAEIAKIKAWLLLAMINGAFGGQSDNTILATRDVFFKNGWQISDPISNRLDSAKFSSFPCAELASVLKLPNPNKTYITNLVWTTQYGEKRAKLLLLILYPSYHGKNINIDHIFPKANMSKYGSPVKACGRHNIRNGWFPALKG